MTPARRGRNISDGFFEAGSIGAIAVAESNPDVIYVGTGSACPRGNVSPGIGMYKSTDAGKTWQHIGLRESGTIGRIVIHPTNPDLVYVAVLGNLFAASKERGVYRIERRRQVVAAGATSSAIARAPSTSRSTSRIRTC